MDAEKRLALYERLYFFEFDSREKLIARLQLSLALFSVVIGVAVYIFARINFDFRPSNARFVFFWVTYLISVAMMIRACHWYSKALWNQEYACLPVSTKIEEYSESLDQVYSAYENGKEIADGHFQAFLSRYYRECAAKNAGVNEERYLSIHRSMRALVCSMPLLVVSALVAIASDMMKPLT